MPQVQFAVFLQDNAWRLLVNGKRMGRFPRRRDALSCAFEMAKLTREDGLEVDILAQDRFGEVRAFPWTSPPLAASRSPPAMKPALASCVSSRLAGDEAA